VHTFTTSGWRRLVAAAAALAALAWIAGPSAQAAAPAVQPGMFRVGVAKVSIGPTFPYPDGSIYVGGVIPGPIRKADGNAAPTYARAVAISSANGRSGVVLASIDIQGAFAAVKQGPFGLDDVQREVAPELGLQPSQIVISSTHTHAGADIMGIWGGSPASYIKQVHDAAALAVKQAWAARRPARLTWASTQAGDMLTNQSNFQGMDEELRVLVASDPDTGQPIAMLPNWQGHPSVVPGNELHPDWPGVLDGILEQRHPGAFGMTFVGDVGHTQTNVGGNTDETVGIAKATGYATALADRIDTALADEPHVVADGPVVASQVFFHETVVGPQGLALEYGNADGAVDLYRSDQPPWLSDVNVLGARVWALRIGDLALAAVPGEAYFWIYDRLHAFLGGRELFMLGLAGDTLGYLVAPSEDIPKFATDVNDNLALLLSPTMGDHVMCALVTASRPLGFPGTTAPDARCAQWATDTPVVVGGS